MGTTKTNLFTNEQNELATWAKAIGHPARIAILQHIVKSATCVNNELVNELGLAQSTVSQHLKALKEVGIIQGTVEGAAMCYCINEKVWKKIEDQFGHFFEHPVTCFNDDCC